LPVDLYNGGMEHTTLHLLYSRFWHKFLYDLGLVPTIEPYQRRYSHGVVLAEDGRKMSKSFNNVIRPDDVITQYGADTLRVYEMFMGPFDQMISWSTKGVQGCWRFLNRIWQLFSDKEKVGQTSDKELITKLHQLIKKVGDDLEVMKFNTAVAAFMEFVNAWSEDKRVLSKKEAEIFLRLLAPLAPHITEELWEKLGHQKSIFLEKWPQYDERLIEEETWQLIIQVNGKVRDKIEVKKGVSEEEVKKLALSQEKIQKWLANKQPKKIIYIPNRLVNLVV
jgi:leucyl-tRNA synthetase